MVNVLIADDNVYYATNLMNYLNKSNKKIRVCSITQNGKETLDILNNSNDIDVVLLDYKMPIYNGKQVLNHINNKNKYQKSIIVISGEIETIRDLEINNMIYSIIYKAVSMDNILFKINELLDYKEQVKNSKQLKSKITDELLYLGYDISHKGTQYLLHTINYIALNPNKEVDILERNVYPIIAKMYSNSAHNIKCNINRSTTAMYYNCEIEKLKKYFGFDKDTKPKVKMVINTILNKMQ